MGHSVAVHSACVMGTVGSAVMDGAADSIATGGLSGSIVLGGIIGSMTGTGGVTSGACSGAETEEEADALEISGMASCAGGIGVCLTVGLARRYMLIISCLYRSISLALGIRSIAISPFYFGLLESAEFV